jgi:hypothetical protein
MIIAPEENTNLQHNYQLDMVDSVDVSARRCAFPQLLTSGPSNIRSLTHVSTLTASDGPAKNNSAV